MNRPPEPRRLGHYRQPYLRAEPVAADPAMSRLELRDGDRRLLLTVDRGDYDVAWQMLETLRDPGSPGWTQISEQPDGGLLELVDRLDRLGWLAEADTTGRTRMIGEADKLRELMRLGVDWLAAAAAEPEIAGGSIDYADALLRYAHPEPPARPMPSRDTDLSAQALSLMLDRWSRTSPSARAMVGDMFGAAGKYLASGHHERPPEPDTRGLTMSNADQIGKQIWAAMVLMVLAASGRFRFSHAGFIPDRDLAGPGLNLLVAAEAAAERLMLARGPSPLLRLIDQSDQPRRVAVGVYLHQYLITQSYIEVVYTFLTHSLRDDLKAAGTQYLTEEIGHQVHELEACRQLGLRDEDVARFAPLPFFAAYSDVLGAIAELDPLAFCLAVSVAEGLPGAGKPIASALAARGIGGESLVAHQRIDERLDHTLVTRRLMQHIPWVGSEAARTAIQRFLFVTDLSQLCWRQLASYADTAALAPVPVVFGMSPQQVLRTFTDDREAPSHER